MRNVALKFVAAAGILALTCQVASAQKISNDVVKIGVLEDMSGSTSTIAGRGNVIAAEMAVADFGGKVLGKPIQIISADHQNKTDISSAKAREWFDRDNVDMITGLAHSASALAVQKLTADRKRIIIVTSAGTDALTGASCTPRTVHYSYDVYALAKVEGAAVVAAGGKTWFFLTNDGAFGHSMQHSITTHITKGGGKVLGTALNQTSAIDFTSQLLQAQASGAQIIGLATSGGELVNAIKQASEFGIGQKGQKLATLVLLETDVKALGLPIAQGMQTGGGFYWDRDKATRDWSQRFFARHKAMPNMIQAGTYSATTNYLKAIQAAGTDDADVVMAKLKSMDIRDFFAVNGRIRADGRMVHDMYLMEVKKPSESKGEWDLFKIVLTVPGDEAFRPLAESDCPLVKK